LREFNLKIVISKSTNKNQVYNPYIRMNFIFVDFLYLENKKSDERRISTLCVEA